MSPMSTTKEKVLAAKPVTAMALFHFGSANLTSLRNQRTHVLPT
jgi:hypothetical protein